MGSKRTDVLKEFKLGRLDVVVTSFEIARADIALMDFLPWSCVIVDEAHRLKNPRSKSSLAYNQFECPVRFGLSGTGMLISLVLLDTSLTPAFSVIQNSYGEMWTILDWSYPGCVGSRKQWTKYVDKPLTKGQSKSASEDEHVRAVVSVLPFLT